MYGFRFVSIGLACSVVVCAACSSESTGGQSSTASSTGVGGASASSSSSAATGGASSSSSGAGGSTSSTGGAGGQGGSITGCANGGAMCPMGQQCCSGVPYPMEGICLPACTMQSDRAIKEGFQSVDRDAVLERLVALDVSEWSYRRDGEAVRHVGPMAQDFRAAFGLGTDDTTIHTVDGQGVTIAAVQALYDRLVRLQAENATLKRDQRALEARLRQLETERRGH